MDAQIAVDLCREALRVGIIIAAPVLIAGVIIGVTIGLLQALTQIQEQTIGIVMKILVMILVLAYTLPWMTLLMMEYTTDLFTYVPERMAE
ncbi:MAG: flagellar biosynthetic protein FliQ [Planctomycetaceae bacterium]|jgi:flagellar biosynthetic protein FliQ|nr:flagellar biosynthetic protein FliQ [Planctomycetaceae bacterium]